MFAFSRTLVFYVAIICLSNVQGRLAGECAMICNDLRSEVLTLEMCRDAKKTLPKPKVGEFCTNAMEQGFSDACIALCMDQVPVNRLAQTCRAAAAEMPRPTVRKWCEHGYRVAFGKTSEDLATHFTHDTGRTLQEEQQQQQEQQTPDEPAAAAGAADVVQDTPEPPPAENEAEIAAETRTIKATVPVTLDDAKEVNLTVYEGQTAEEAVVAFCREHLSDDVSACIRQLLPIALEKLEGVAA